MHKWASVSFFALGVATAGVTPAAGQVAPDAVQPQPDTGQSARDSRSTRDDFAVANDIRSAVVGGEPAETSGGDIVVTGTRIVRPNTRSAAPIVTTTAAEIQAQGATTIEEVLNRLPQVQANSEQNFSDSEGRQRIKLRSLSYERTLMLIDGLRFGIANTIDVGIIPTALVERVDVLTGGASSVYGADAVAGVVNFILKKNFEGIRVDGQYSFFNHNNRDNAVTDAARRSNYAPPTGTANDGGRVDLSLAAGVNLFDNRVNLSSFINYRQSDMVQLVDRSHSFCEVIQPTNTSPLSCSFATVTPAGTIIPRTGPRTDQLLVNNPNGNGTFVPINSGPNTAANPYDDFPFQRPFERVNVGGFLTVDLAENAEFYGSGLYYRDVSSSPILNRLLSSLSYPGQVPYQVGCNNPFLSAAQARDIGCAALGSTAIVPIDVRYRFDAFGPQDVRNVNLGYRFVSGLRGRTGDGAWSYDVAGMIARSELDTDFGTPLPDRTRVGRALDVVNVNGVPTCRSVVNGTDPGCVPFNAFAPFNNDRAAFDYMYTGLTVPTQNTASRMLQFLGTVSGDLGNYGITSPWAEQGVAVALGVEYRDELLNVEANPTFRLQQGGENGRFTQNILESNIELQVPVAENQPWADRLDINAGYRLSRYNRLDGNFDTWKIEGVWAPIADITLRGSYNKSQAAAGVAALQNAANVIYQQGFYADPCAPRVDPTNVNGPRLAPIATIEQCRRTGLPDNLYASPTLICPDDRCTVRNGGFDLRPETAFTTTFGVILSPRFVPGLTVSVDRWLIDLEDELAFLQPQNLINGCLLTGDDFFCRGIVRNPGSFTLGSPPAGNPATGWAARGNANGFRSQSHGWDFQGQYNLALGSAGRLDMGFNGTLMTRVGAQESPTVNARNCVGYFGRTCGESLPRWVHQFRTTWISPSRAASVSINWRHRGAMPLDVYAPADTGIPTASADARRDQFPGIGAFNWFDLAVTFEVARDMTFRLAANNIFDRDPPVVPDSRSVTGLMRTNSIHGYDFLGRQIVAGVSMNF